MYVGRDFSPADQGEDEVFSLDFVNDLAVGETLSNATWHCSVAEDSPNGDTAAASHIDGAAQVSGTVALQRVSGLVPGVKYVLQAVVVTSANNTKSLWSHVTCGEPA